MNNYGTMAKASNQIEKDQKYSKWKKDVLEDTWNNIVKIKAKG